MSSDKNITINGQAYDAVTGLPVAKKSVTPKRPAQSNTVHSPPQKSKTLVRRVTKKPVTLATTSAHRTPGKSMDIARSSNIARFAAHPKPVTVAARPHTADIAPTAHPLLTKTHAKQAQQRMPAPVTAPLTSQQVKNQAIAHAMAQPVVKSPKKSFFKRHPRLLSIGTLSILVVALAVYFTYTNIPSISVRVAAAQAGIDATYPEYRPDGYSLDGPVTFSDGQVTINFAANTGTSKFIIKQAKSSWDSTAVLNNVVKVQAGEKYITSQERGLTIYTYGGNAAWVNGGILYTINGDAPLSGDQIRRIATSL